MIDNTEINLNELSALDDELAIICQVFGWLRPDDVTQVDDVAEKVEALTQTMRANPEQADLIRKKLREFIVELRFLPLYSDTGILPRRNFAAEFWRRAYNKLLPEPPVVFSAKNLVDFVFDVPSDPEWVQAVPDKTWIQLYRAFLFDESDKSVELHMLIEVLYALEMLSIWLAAEELEGELLRLDPSIFNYDSDFIAQEREISQFVAAYRAQLLNSVDAEHPDASHAWIMLQQSAEQIKRFQKLALEKGSDLQLTYLLERLEQILERIRQLLDLLEIDNAHALSEKSLTLFRQLVTEQSDEHSVISLTRQTSYLLAKSVVNHASKTGEHYVTEDHHEYIDMIKSGLGAGVFIAIMALIKIYIVSVDLPEGWSTFWISMNYGLGFVIIHMLHFTVATKQPAMTAAYIAKMLERAQNGNVAHKELAQLIIKVGRSQFAAIIGNVAAALPVALLIGFAVESIFGGGVMKPDKAATLMHEQNPVTSLALFYAAIAGLWLFVSGLVAGYFDNRCLYVNLPERLRQHPLLKRILSPKQQNFLADYIRGHYGALIGNFFFGVMLGVTGYLGYLWGLPLDIRHVAFSVANVGYSVTVTWPGAWIFVEFVSFALLIGVMNLTVSFFLALNVAVRSRGIHFGSSGSIASAYWREIRSKPLALILPSIAKADRSQQHI